MTEWGNEMIKRFLAALIFGALLSSSLASAEEADTKVADVDDSKWGSITGHFVLDGKLPEAKSPKVDARRIRDSEVCAAGLGKRLDLVVDKKSKGIANIFVYIHRPKVVHPQHQKPPKNPAVLSIKSCHYFPHCQVVRTGQPVLLKNSDPIAHNAHNFAIKNQSWGILNPPNNRDGIPVGPLPLAERLPFLIRCDLHPWMKAYFLVIDHPYAVVTDSKGKFTIEHLPEGEHSFRVWHERVGYINRE